MMPLFMNNASYTWNRKEWGESKIEREQIKSERRSVAKKGLWHGS
jgi:hypothetical protein